MAMDLVISISFVCFTVYYLVVVGAIFNGNCTTLFFKATGIKHRLCGLVYLTLLIVLSINGHFMFFNYQLTCVTDIILNVLGIILSVTAAYGFGATSHHKKMAMKNVEHGSGLLDEDKVVSFGEMIEHSFYHLLFLFHIIFFHIIYNFDNNDSSRYSILDFLFDYNGIILLGFVEFPWVLRQYYPSHSLSANYTKGQITANSYEGMLYRAKKFQYILYKHLLFHSLNINIILHLIDKNDTIKFKFNNIVMDQHFRLYWVSLSLGYTSDFFLQTLVRRKRLTQWNMILIQQCLLMPMTSMSVIPIVYKYARFDIAIISTILNFVNRKHDFINTLGLFAVALLLQNYWGIYESMDWIMWPAMK